jgi:two-component system nitrogen regulation sensor histidine kinase GlnL
MEAKFTLDLLTQATVVLDHEGGVCFSNEAAAQLWVLNAERLQQLHAEDLFPDDPEVLRHVEQVFSTGKTIRRPGLHPQSRLLAERVLDVIASPVLDDSGGVTQVLLCLLDTTHHHAAQAREVEERIMEQLGLMTASLAHEIRNPLSGIKGALQLIQRDAQVSRTHGDAFGLMLGELERIERLLQNLQHFAHPAPLHLQSVDLHELLASIIEFEKQHSPMLRFHAHFDLSLPPLHGDRDKLHQIFLNLVRNAVEASPPEGRVRLETRPCSRWELAGTTLDPSQSYLLVTLSDEGHGVAPEDVEQLFKPFFTTKTSGHGLGLPITHRLIRAHGGQIRYAPAKSGGACFEVLLPWSRNSELGE